MDYPDLYFLRHGETQWNAEGRMQGWLDSPLTPRGREHAAGQGHILRAIGLDLKDINIWVSPSGRTVETAQHALPGVPFKTDARLREINVGTWQGALLSDLKRDHPQYFDEASPLAWYDLAEGGEGFDRLAERCRSVLADLTGPTLFVTHGITSRMMRCLVLGKGPDRIEDVPGGQGCVHAIKQGETFLYT